MCDLWILFCYIGDRFFGKYCFKKNERLKNIGQVVSSLENCNIECKTATQSSPRIIDVRISNCSSYSLSKWLYALRLIYPIQKKDDIPSNYDLGISLPAGDWGNGH